MPFLVRLVRCALFLVLGLGLSGCFPSGRSQLDEEKDPHFLAGKSRVNALDYEGALDCFEKALEANPHSSLAHFEAGLLYERQAQGHAAAIYHFQRFLQLRPNSGYADVVKQHIWPASRNWSKPCRSARSLKASSANSSNLARGTSGCAKKLSVGGPMRRVLKS